MRIREIRAYSRDLALTKPYVIAYQNITAVENVFVEIELDNGMIGRGAANPDPDVVDESSADVLHNLRTDQVMRWIGADIREMNRLLNEAERLFGHCPGTLAALDIALHDAFGQLLGIPVVRFYGQHIRALPTSVTIGIMGVDDTLREAGEYLKQGFRVVKVKTGQDVAQDCERVIRLNETFGNRLTVRVDVNQGYTPDDLRLFMHMTRQVSPELIEQPLPVGAEAELSGFPSEVRRILAADESLTDGKAAVRLAQDPQPFGIFNIKLMKCGGIRAALGLGNIARHAGIRLFWGCNDESRVSIAAALHAAFACSNTQYLDLDGSLDLAEDIAGGGFTLDEGFMRPLELPGLGLHSVTS